VLCILESREDNVQIEEPAMPAAIKNILVPTDFTSAARRALRYAGDLADAFGASLQLIHVIETPLFSAGYMDLYAPPPPEYLASLEQQSQRQLEGLLTADEKATYRAVFVTKLGVPAHEILDYVKAHTEIDLVVMATEGRGGMARLVLGSVADKVLRAAPCPVVAIHPHDRSSGATADYAA
jgi:nucleotide-binding universal stress UspA family protein